LNSKLFIVCLLLVTLSACRPAQKTSIQAAPASDTTSEAPTADPAAPQIAFFNIQMQRDSSTKAITATLQKTHIVDGQLKKDINQEARRVPNGLLCSFLDKDQQLIKQVVLENPLQKWVEYTNAEGQLQSKMITPDQGSFFIRTQWQANMHLLQLQAIDQELNLLPITILNIKQ